MRYNRSEIMKRAWRQYRAKQLGKTYIGGKLVKFTFSDALKWAWAVEKEDVAREEKKNSMTIMEKIEAVENSLFTLGMKDLWTAKDFETEKELTDELDSLKGKLAA